MGFSQKQVADYIESNQSQIVKLENGEMTLKVSSLLKLCELYVCDEKFLVFGKGRYNMPDYHVNSNKKFADLKAISNINRIIANLRKMKILSG